MLSMCLLNQSLLAQTLHFIGPTGLWGAFPPLCLALPLLFQRFFILFISMTNRMNPNIFYPKLSWPKEAVSTLMATAMEILKGRGLVFLIESHVLLQFSHFILYTSLPPGPFPWRSWLFSSQVVLRGPACAVASYRATGLVRGCCSFRMALIWTSFFLVGVTHPWDGNFDGWELWCEGLCVRAGKIHTILGTNTSLGIKKNSLALSPGKTICCCMGWMSILHSKMTLLQTKLP